MLCLLVPFNCIYCWHLCVCVCVCLCSFHLESYQHPAHLVIHCVCGLKWGNIWISCMMRLGWRALQKQPDKRADSVWRSAVTSVDWNERKWNKMSCFETQNITFLNRCLPAECIILRYSSLPHIGVGALKGARSWQIIHIISDSSS